MNQPMKSFILVLLVEGLCALASYLTEKLMRHMHSRNLDNDYDYEPDYA